MSRSIAFIVPLCVALAPFAALAADQPGPVGPPRVVHVVVDPPRPVHHGPVVVHPPCCKR